MSIPLAVTTLTPSVPVNIPIKNVATIQALKLSNSSPYDLTISGFGVKGQEIVPGGTEYRLYAEQENQGFLLIVPVDNTQAGGTGFINIVLYGMDEPLPKGNWPVAIPTQKVTAKVTSVTNLINDGNAAGTQIIEATPSGDSSSAVSVLNDGTLVLGNSTHKGSISCSNGAFTVDASGNVVVGSGAKITTPEVDSPAATDLVLNVPTGHTLLYKVNGVQKAQFDGNGSYIAAGGGILWNGFLGVSANGDRMDATGTNTYLKAANSILFQVPNGTSIASVDSTGINLLSGSINLLAGTISKINGGDNIACGSGTTINHGLGTTPQMVVATPNISQPGSATVGVSNLGATTFRATVGAGTAIDFYVFHG